MIRSMIQRVYTTCKVALLLGLTSFLCSCDSDSPRPPTGPTPSDDATLASLTTSIAGFPGALTPGLFSYSSSVAFSTDTLLIQAAASDTSATVRVHDPGFPGQSFKLGPGATYGPANLNVGQNILVVEVIAENQTKTSLYTLNVQRFP